MVIAPRFVSRGFGGYSLDSEIGFREGLAVVELNGKYGYINKLGKFVISPKYKYAGDFKDGLVFVSAKDEKRYFRYFIDKSGKVIIKIKK